MQLTRKVINVGDIQLIFGVKVFLHKGNKSWLAQGNYRLSTFIGLVIHHRLTRALEELLCAPGGESHLPTLGYFKLEGANRIGILVANQLHCSFE